MKYIRKFNTIMNFFKKKKMRFIPYKIVKINIKQNIRIKLIKNHGSIKI